MFNEIFARRLRLALEGACMSRYELAQAVNLTESAISRYLAGQRMPNGEVLIQIAHALNTTTDYLLGSDCGLDSETVYDQVLSRVQGFASVWSEKQRAELIRRIVSTAIEE